jgi:amidase
VVEPESAEREVEQLLAMVEQLDPLVAAVNAVSSRALDDARELDRETAQGHARSPLHGRAVLVKDNVDTAGLASTAGSLALADSPPSADAPLVSRLRQAGMVVLGKTNLSEWANIRDPHSTSGWSAHGGLTRNPYALNRTAWGSSSGSGAAVAARLAAFAVGTETDGSIISPSSACGLVGMKPTLGLVSRSGIVPISPAQDTAGPMARSVADAALLLDALAGPDPADEATTRAPALAGSFGALLDPGALDGARIGVWRDGSAAATPATVALLDAAVARLRAAGAQLTDPVELPGTAGIGEPEFAALLHEFKHYLNAYLASVPGDHPANLADLIAYNSSNAASVLTHFGQELFERAEATSGDLADPGYQKARREAGALATTALDSALRDGRLDAVVALSGSPAWLTDHVLGDHHVFGTSGPTAVAGYPSVTVPSGTVAGLPVGMTFMGPAWSEARLLALAYAYEQAGS